MHREAVAEALCGLRMLQRAYRYSRPLVEVTAPTTGVTDVWVAIKGTDGFEDVVADVSRAPVPFPAGGSDRFRAHSGFVSVHNEVFAALVSGYGDDLRCATRVVLCGHSLGGAVASLLAVSLARWYPMLRVVVYTFGSPRVMNAALAARHDAVVWQAFRIFHDRDPVVCLPWFGYKHVGGRTCFGSNGKLEGRLRGGWYRVLHWLRFRRQDLADHTLSSYVWSLQMYEARLPVLPVTSQTIPMPPVHPPKE